MSSLRRLLATSAVAVTALAGPSVGQALAEPGHFSISDGHVAEGGIMQFTINYQRNNTTSPSTGTVFWKTTDLTASAAAGDYVPSGRQESMTTLQSASNPGGSSASAVITVPVLRDLLVEGPETFRVTLNSPGTDAAAFAAGYRTDIVDTEGIGTIDDQVRPPEDDHHHTPDPVVITVPGAPQAPPAATTPQAPPINTTTQSPVTVSVQGQTQPQGVAQQLPVQLPATPNTNVGQNAQLIDDDETGPTMGMQFRGLTTAAKVRLRCPATEKSCRGQLALQLSGKTLGTTRYAMAGGATRSVEVPLTRSERKSLRRAAGFYLRAITIDAAGNRQSTTRGFLI